MAGNRRRHENRSRTAAPRWLKWTIAVAAAALSLMVLLHAANGHLGHSTTAIAADPR